MYDEFLSTKRDITLVLDDSTSVLLKVPDTESRAKFLDENTSPTIVPVAPVFDWVIVSPSNKYALDESSI